MTKTDPYYNPTDRNPVATFNDLEHFFTVLTQEHKQVVTFTAAENVEITHNRSYYDTITKTVFIDVCITNSGDGTHQLTVADAYKPDCDTPFMYGDEAHDSGIVHMQVDGTVVGSIQSDMLTRITGTYVVE